ncbi:MAG: 30S ribosomal protein S8 [Chlamydiia bacterium]
MTVSDPIADLIVRIKNGIAAVHKYVDCPLSKQKVAILTVLKDLGYINDFIINEELRLLRVYIRYGANRKSRISAFRRLSSPGRRLYVTADSIPYIKNRKGEVLLSTSSGVICGTEARNKRIGGEIICSVS